MLVYSIGETDDKAKLHLAVDYPGASLHELEYRPSRAEGNPLGKIWSYWIATGWIPSDDEEEPPPTIDEAHAFLFPTPPGETEIDQAVNLLGSLFDKMPVL